MSLSNTLTLKHLRLITVVFGALLFSLLLAVSVRTAHATSYVHSGTITLCHAGTGPTNTWNTLAVNATIPSGSFGVTFQVQSASDCSSTPGAFTGQAFTVANGNTTAQNISGAAAASKALFVQITLTGDGTNTPVLNSATLVDTPGSTPDTTPPTVSINALSGTQTGSVTVSATATDNTGGSGVARVDFREASGACSASSTLIGTATTPSSGNTYSVSWDTSGVANGTYNVCAIATDGATNASSPSSTSVTVSNGPAPDTTPPTSTLSSPGTGNLSGTVNLSATATDNTGGSGVAKVDFREATGACSASSTLIASATSPASGSTYTVSWNTTTVANAAYNVCTVATDRSGNVQSSPSSQSVTVSNVSTQAATVWLTPTDGATITPASNTSLKVNTSNYSPAVSKVTFKDGSTTIGTATSGTSASNGGRDWSVTWNTSSLSGSHTLSAAVTNTSNVVQPAATITVTVGSTPIDTQPPTAPSNLSASASSSSAIHLSWTASTDNVGVTGYNIYRNGSTTVSATTTSTTFDDTGLSPTTTYSYIVKAFDARNNISPASNSASATTPCAGDCQPPSAPTNLTGSASLNGTTAVKVSLSWTASSDNVGVASYLVLRNGQGIATVTSPSYVDTTPSPNTNYTYTVVARDAAGNASAASNAFSVTTPQLPDTQAPTVPQNVSATAVTPTQVNVTWNASTDNVGVNHYSILRNGSQVGTSTTTSFGDGSVSAGTTYNYTVQAVDAAGNASSPSAVASVTTPQANSQEVPVYRMYQASTGDHFYTTSTVEVQFAESIANPYLLEKVAFESYANITQGTPIFRLYQPSSGHHFYTDSVSDVQAVLSFPTNPFVLEDANAFNEDASSAATNSPVFRLYQSSSGDHFYTKDQSDVSAAEAAIPPYVLEETAWYAPN